MEQDWGIIGHKNIVKYLDNCIQGNRLVHTYLFYGIKHLGKSTVALKFAKKLLAKSDGHHNTDLSSILFNKKEKNNFISDDLINTSQATANSTRKVLDLFELKVEKGKKDISIEQVRDWQHWLNLKSFGDGYKVGIIYQVECLNNQSANALLKTIEEPAANTIIILITSAHDSLLSTITSRSQKIHFLPVSNKEMNKSLESRVNDKNKINKINDFSLGRPGLAMKFLEDQEFYNEYLNLHKQVEGLWQQNLASRFIFIENFLKGKNNQENIKLAGVFLKHFEMILRKKLLTGDDNINFLNLFNLHLKTKFILQRNIQPKLALENLLINI